MPSHRLFMSYRGHSSKSRILHLQQSYHQKIHTFMYTSIIFITKENIEHGRLHTIVFVFWFCCTNRNGHKAVASEWDISVSFLDPDKGKSVSAYAIFLISI